MSLSEAHRRVINRTVAIVFEVKPDHLRLPTPCAGWTLQDLLGHMVAQHVGFAAAAGGQRTDLEFWRPRPLGADPAARYAEAAEAVLAAFAEPDARRRDWYLPEIRDGGPFPAHVGMSFHLVDYVVHGWDVAASLSLPADFDADLVEIALGIAERVPDGPERLGPGAAFAPGLPAASGASGLDRVLTLLGRSPNWPDPTPSA